jgi:hypothetical protein
MPPVAVPFPISALPGRRPGEGQGDLINCYARKAGNLIRWQRVPGTKRFTQGNGQRQFFPPALPAPALPQLVKPRGQLAFDNYLISVWGDKVTRTTAAEPPVEEVLTGTMPGVEPVTMARNMRPAGPQMVAVSDGTAYWLDMTAGLTGTIKAYPAPTTGGPLGFVNSVDYFSGYFVFSRPNGEIVATDPQTMDFNPLSFTKAEAVADGLLRMFSAQPILLACGQQSIEVYQDVAASPFPFQRVTVLPCGLLSPSAIAGGPSVWDRPVCFVANDYTVRQLKGLDPVIISNEDVVADITECARSGLADQFRAQVYTHGDNAIWSLTGAHDDDHLWTWEYNLSTGSWHRRRSYQPGNEHTDEPKHWRAMFSANFFHHWIAQDELDGGLIEITADEHKEPEIIRANPNPIATTPPPPPYIFLQAPLVARCESGPAKENPANLRMAAIYLDFTVAFDVIEAPDPLVLLSWSHDGGATWSNPLERRLGSRGEYRTLVTLRSTGRSSHQGMRLRWEIVDPVPIAFHGAIAPRTTASRPRQVDVVNPVPSPPFLRRAGGAGG